jgi:FkbM family methyltransferase
MREIDRFETLFGPMFHYADDEVIGQSLRRYGQWAIDEIALLSHIHRHDTHADFIDLGANVGTHTVAIATLFPDAKVYAFEANRPAYQFLCTNITGNGLANVKPFNHLVSDVSAMSRVVASEPQAGRDLGAVSFQVVPLQGAAGSLMLQVAIDDVYDADGLVALIKADLPGMQLSAFQGARVTLRRCHPALYFENGGQCNTGPLFDELAELGYEPFWHVNFLFDKENFRGDTTNVFGSSVEIGTLCIHRESPLVDEFRQSLTPVSRVLDERAWQQCLALNARLRADIKARMTPDTRTAWLRARLLSEFRACVDPVDLDTRPASGETLPPYADIRRAMLLDVPGDVLRSLLAPYLAATSFDEAAYLQRNPDVAEAVAARRLTSAREHYVTVGYFEGRSG